MVAVRQFVGLAIIVVVANAAVNNPPALEPIGDETQLTASRGPSFDDVVSEAAQGIQSALMPLQSAKDMNETKVDSAKETENEAGKAETENLSAVSNLQIAQPHAGLNSLLDGFVVDLLQLAGVNLDTEEAMEVDQDTVAAGGLSSSRRRRRKPTPSASETPSATGSPSATESPSATVSPSGDVSPSPSPTGTPSSEPTVSPTASPSQEPSTSNSATASPSSSSTPTPSSTPSATAEPSESMSTSLSPSHSISPPASASGTSSPSSSPSSSTSPSETPSTTNSGSTSLSPSASLSEGASSTSSASESPSLSVSPEPSESPSASADASESPSLSMTPSESESPSNSETPSVTLTASPSSVPLPPLPTRAVQPIVPSVEPFTPHALERAMYLKETVKPWSYDASSGDGPENWSNLDSTFATCNDPTSKQSPIDLYSFRLASPMSPLVTPMYKSGMLLVRHTGNYLRLIPHTGSLLYWGDRTYELVYGAVHTPSEHHMGGESFPVELQLVHKSRDDDEIAVVSLLYKQGLANPFLDRVLESAPTSRGEEEFLSGAINFGDAIPRDITQYKAGTRISYPHFTYEGSLSAPPCDENVRYFVWSKPDHVSKDQIDALNRLVNSNAAARPLQSANERVVELRTLF